MMSIKNETAHISETASQHKDNNIFSYHAQVITNIYNKLQNLENIAREINFYASDQNRDLLAHKVVEQRHEIEQLLREGLIE